MFNPTFPLSHGSAGLLTPEKSSFGGFRKALQAEEIYNIQETFQTYTIPGSFYKPI